MINKKSVWFLTLFSLILVLSVYYITMPSELLLGNNNNTIDEILPVINESTILVALRVNSDEELKNEMDNLQSILTNQEASIEEKSEAFDKMKSLNNNKSLEQSIEQSLKETLNLNSFIKISNDQIEIVIESSDHSNEVANNVMRKVQEFFETKMYITVKFTN